MLKIEIREPRDGICPKCEGTGIVIPKSGEKRVVEVGTFCDRCPDGATRWDETKLVLEREGNA